MLHDDLKSIVPADLSTDELLAAALLALNNANAQELSWLEPEPLEYLVQHGFLPDE
jgi:uncharacterized protein